MKKKCGLLHNIRYTNVCVCIIWQSHWIKYQACPHFIPFFFCSLRSLVAEFLRKTYIKRLSRLHWIISQICTREMKRQSEKNWDFFLSIDILQMREESTTWWLCHLRFERKHRLPPPLSPYVCHTHTSCVGMRERERECENSTKFCCADEELNKLNIYITLLK